MVGRSTPRLPQQSMQPASQPALRRASGPLPTPLFALVLTAEVSRFPPIVLCVVGCVCVTQANLRVFLSGRPMIHAALIPPSRSSCGSTLTANAARAACLPERAFSFPSHRFHVQILPTHQGRVRHIEHVRTRGRYADSGVASRLAAGRRGSGSAFVCRCIFAIPTTWQGDVSSGCLANLQGPQRQRKRFGVAVPRSGRSGVGAGGDAGEANAAPMRAALLPRNSPWGRTVSSAIERRPRAAFVRLRNRPRTVGDRPTDYRVAGSVRSASSWCRFSGR